MTHILMSRGILGHPGLVEQFSSIIKSDMKVAIVLYSFFENQFQTINDYDAFYEKGSEYYEKMINSFLPYGIKEKNITWINYYHDSTEEAKKKITASDILYFPGGAPDLMMKRIIEKGLKEAIEAHQKIYIGSSAGAMIQLKNYHISKDNEYASFRYEEGLNLLNGFSIEVHYRKKNNQKRAMRKVFRSFHQPIIGIPDDGAVLVNTEGVVLYGSAKLIYGYQGIVI